MARTSLGEYGPSEGATSIAIAYSRGATEFLGAPSRWIRSDETKQPMKSPNVDTLALNRSVIGSSGLHAFRPDGGGKFAVIVGDGPAIETDIAKRPDRRHVHERCLGIIRFASRTPVNAPADIASDPPACHCGGFRNAVRRAGRRCCPSRRSAGRLSRAGLPARAACGCGRTPTAIRRSA